MADDETPEVEDEADEEETPTPESERGKPVHGMTEQEIRDAGLAIDVPFETGPGLERLKYADLGPEKSYTPPPGWEPGQPIPPGWKPGQKVRPPGKPPEPGT